MLEMISYAINSNNELYILSLGYCISNIIIYPEQMREIVMVSGDYSAQ
ncbi:MAG: hypothetical protein JWP78_323 [Mucilaginibacter sp.]|nr:hypothetical protein [Mucilaginibacter sp.]